MRHHFWAVRDEEQGKWITFTRQDEVIIRRSDQAK